MAYVPTADDRMKVRYEIADTEAGLYILDDSTLDYYLVKNNGNILRSSLEAARAVLLRISLDSDWEQVDILSIKPKAAENYRLALELYIKSPTLNPVLNNATIWIGGVSKSEMEANNTDCDNNINSLSVKDLEPECGTTTAFNL